MTELLKIYAHMKQEYASVLKFFGEDPTTMRIDEFFSTFAAFISDFEVHVVATIFNMHIEGSFGGIYFRGSVGLVIMQKFEGGDLWQAQNPSSVCTVIYLTLHREPSKRIKK